MAPQIVGIIVNGKPAGTLRVTGTWARQTALLAPGLLNHDLNDVEFVYERTARPKDSDPTAQDPRDLAVMFDDITIAPLPTSRSIDLGTPPARLQMLDGWSVDERQGERTAVWNDGALSVLAFRQLEVPSGRSVLRIAARAFGPALPLNVEVAMNGKALGSVQPRADWSTLEVEVPESGVVRGVNLIELRYGRTVRPSVVNPASKDVRDLALRVDRVEMTSR